jgi:hypothetical protein
MGLPLDNIELTCIVCLFGLQHVCFTPASSSRAIYQVITQDEQETFFSSAGFNLIILRVLPY